MATAAFKSTTKRTQIGSQENNNGSTSSPSKPARGHRRSRSLSHFGPVYTSDIYSSTASSVLRQIDIPNNDVELNKPPVEPNKPPVEPNKLPAEPDKPPSSRNVSPQRGFKPGPFVNTARGASAVVDSPPVADRGRSHARRGRSVCRFQTESSSESAETEKLERRGRSISRNNPSNKTAVNPPDNGRRRQRSVSVVRHHHHADSISESDMDSIYNRTGSNKLNNHAAADGRRNISEKLSGGDVVKPQQGLRRCSSQTDLSRSYDTLSSNGSVVTDDEGLDVTHSDQGEEKTIRAVYAQMKSLRSDHPTGEMDAVDILEAMRSEVRHAIAELKTELEQTGAKNSPSTASKGSNDLLKPRSADVRKNYTVKLEKSEKRARDLRTELAVEEQRRQELAKILEELLSGPNPSQTQRPLRRRRKSADRKQMSKSLNEEAQKFIDEFLSMSNIEDSELSSSFEEEQHNASTHGRKREENGKYQASVPQIASTEKCSYNTQHVPLSVENDGVVLPWLQWETNPDSQPQFSRADLEAVMTEKNVQQKFTKADLEAVMIQKNDQQFFSKADLEAVLTEKNLQQIFPEEVGSNCRNNVFDSKLLPVTSSTYSSERCIPDSSPPYNISKLDSSIVDSLSLSSTRISREIRDERNSSKLNDSVKPIRDYGKFPKSTYQDDEYILHANNEAILVEKLKLGSRIESGGIFLCGTRLF